MKKCTVLIKQLLLVLSVGLGSTQMVYAQNSSDQEISIKQLPRFSTFSAMNNFHADFSGKEVDASLFKGKLLEWLGGSSDDTLQLVSEVVDDLGIKHSKYQHLYKGVPVADDLVLVHEKNNKITAVNGEFSKGINLNVSPALSQQEAETIVKNELNAPKVTFEGVELVIAKVQTGKTVDTKLTTKINALALSALKGFDYYIDNATKQIVKKLAKIHHHGEISKALELSKKYNTIAPFVDTSSTSTTYYKGNQSITVDSNNGGYRLKDNTRNIHTLNGTGWDGSGNPATGELTGSIVEYISTTPNFTANDTRAAVEVHWSMKNAYDYYQARHNRNSYDGNGSIIRNYYNINFNVNPSTGVPTAPVNGANAAAIDTQGIVAMAYGNGLYNGQSGYFNPFVGIDVSGHEYSHLMVSRTANLAYQGESGALNESFADMFGTAIEFYSNVSPNWTIGEGLPNPALGFTFLRSMSNPNSGPAALGSQQPDTYNGTYWADTTPSAPDSGGVHTNSGVGNYWFYLLSMGGSGTNDIGNAFNVSPITIQVAERIAFRTLVHYLTPNSNYLAAYNASKQAVTDLYGASGNEQLQNVRAWYAVGIGDGLLAVADTNVAADGLEVYPNPIKDGIINIESKLNIASGELYDASGKLVKASTKISKGTSKITIPELKTGVYILKVQSDSGTVSKKIIVK